MVIKIMNIFSTGVPDKRCKTCKKGYPDTIHVIRITLYSQINMCTSLKLQRNADTQPGNTITQLTHYGKIIGQKVTGTGKY
jgi:hypothetical protein